MGVSEKFTGCCWAPVDVHLAVVHNRQVVCPPLLLEDVVYHQTAILIQKQDASGATLHRTEVCCLVRLSVFHSRDAQQLFTVSPIPHANLPIQIVCDDMLAAPGNTPNTIHQRPNPSRVSNSTGLSTFEVELPVWKVLKTVGWRGYKLHIYGFLHSNVVQQQQIGAAENKRADGMHRQKHRSRFVPLQAHRLALFNVVDGEFGVRARHYAVIYNSEVDDRHFLVHGDPSINLFLGQVEQEHLPVLVGSEQLGASFLLADFY